ncbi:MAG: hypothetical protein ACK5LZ_05095 [Anaerorhabdus sp.]
MKKYGLIFLLMVGMMGCSQEKETVEYESIEELVESIRSNPGMIEHIGAVARTIYRDGNVEEFKAVVINRKSEIKAVYETAWSDKMRIAINEAAIISQGKGATGYEEAMQASYETAVANGSGTDYETFAKNYSDNISKYNEQLQEMRGLSFAEMVERYEEFESILDLIESNLNILG